MINIKTETVPCCRSCFWNKFGNSTMHAFRRTWCDIELSCWPNRCLPLSTSARSVWYLSTLFRQYQNIRTWTSSCPMFHFRRLRFCLLNVSGNFRLSDGSTSSIYRCWATTIYVPTLEIKTLEGNLNFPATLFSNTLPDLNTRDHRLKLQRALLHIARLKLDFTNREPSFALILYRHLGWDIQLLSGWW